MAEIVPTEDVEEFEYPAHARICVNCRYFHDYRRDIYPPQGGDGECRRYAPRPSQHTRWAKVDEADWCGEFVPEEVSRREGVPSRR